jgi:hypothetical protein
VTIPKSLTSIGKWVFGGCKALDSITFNGTIDQWNGITKGANWKDGVPATVVVHCTDGDVTL